MKVFKKLLCCVCALSFAVSAFAANDDVKAENRDENGKIVRGPYLANGIWDNWFIGVDGGINLFMNSAAGYSGLVAPYVGAYAGKWIDPLFGARVGYAGIQGRQNGANSLDMDEKMLAKFGYFYIHGDAMFNFTNAVWGYKEARIWNVVPYLHVGALRIYNVEDATAELKPSKEVHKYDNEIAFGAGLFNTFRITPRLHATLDIRETMFSGRYHDWSGGGIASDLSVSAGLMVNLGKVGWDRGVAKDDNSEALAALAAAEAALLAAQQANKDLQDKNDQLANALNEAKEPVNTTDTVYVKLPLGVAPLTLFFDKNMSTLSETELKHLSYYVETVISKDPDRVFKLTGSADKSTGTLERNQQLARERVENTIKVLKEKYGLDDSRFEIKDTIVGDFFSSAELDRSVLIEH